MKKFFFITLFFISLFTQAQITFQKTYGGTNGSGGVFSGTQTKEGEYIFVGTPIIKINSDGDTLWTKTYAGTKPGDGGNSIAETLERGFIIAGTAHSFALGIDDAYLLKTDSMGNVLWSKNFGGTSWDIAYSVQQTFNGSYIVAGVTGSFGAGDDDFYLIKTNSNGDTLWTKTYGGTGRDDGNFLQQTSDSGYIIVGTTQSFGAGANDIYAIKTDINGNVLWSKTYGSTGNDFGYSVEQTNDNGYIISGYRDDNFSIGYYDVYLIKIDSSGNLIWSKIFGGTDGDYSNCVHQTSDGGYILVGKTVSFGNGDEDCYLIKTTSNGNLLWSKLYGDSDEDAGTFVQQTADGGYAILGAFDYWGAGSLPKIYFIKTDSLGHSGCNEGNPNTIELSPATIVTNPSTLVSSGGIITNRPTLTSDGGTVTTLCFANGINDFQTSKPEINIFPNPFSTSATIQVNGNRSTVIDSEFKIYDVFGKEVKKFQVSSSKFQVERGNLSSGIYFYKLSAPSPKGEGWGEVIGAGKVVIE
ncbi:MAG: T9SS type A sorting domain-containing protein [Bacteroidetes bacterium]|nr:T9SS type A sorting domain-containing protein [Bacteroidota bacterium]